jgi:hypothetical protein
VKVLMAPLRRVEDWLLCETPVRKLRRWRAQLECGHLRTVYTYETEGGAIFDEERLRCDRCPQEEV